MFYKEKWSEITEGIISIGYSVKTEYIKQDKCEFCDEKGYLEYTSINGEKIKQYCPCRRSKSKHVPEERKLISIEMFKCYGGWGNKNTLNQKFVFASSDEEERNISLLRQDIRTKFNGDKSTYNVIYDNLEECQKHCDFLNESESK